MGKEAVYQKREPSDPYECWCMPCSECVYYDEAREKCTHPEAFEEEDWMGELFK